MVFGQLPYSGTTYEWISLKTFLWEMIQRVHLSCLRGRVWMRASGSGSASEGVVIESHDKG